MIRMIILGALGALGPQGAPSPLRWVRRKKGKTPTENCTLGENHTFGGFLARNQFFVICWTSTATIRIGLLIVGQQYGIEDMYAKAGCWPLAGCQHPARAPNILPGQDVGTMGPMGPMGSQKI